MHQLAGLWADATVSRKDNAKASQLAECLANRLVAPKGVHLVVSKENLKAAHWEQNWAEQKALQMVDWKGLQTAA